jgi:hypothetical protein
MRCRRLLDLAIVAVVGSVLLALAAWLAFVGWEIVRWAVGDSFSPMPLPSLVGFWVVCMPLVFVIAAWDDSKARRAEPAGDHDRGRRLENWLELDQSDSLDAASWFMVARGIPALGVLAFFILFLPTVIVLHGLELDFSRGLGLGLWLGLAGLGSMLGFRAFHRVLYGRTRIVGLAWFVTIFLVYDLTKNLKA